MRLGPLWMTAPSVPRYTIPVLASCIDPESVMGVSPGTDRYPLADALVQLGCFGGVKTHGPSVK